MRFIVLSVLALLALPAAPSSAQSGASDRSIADKLPLFAKNNCRQNRDPANQLFCGDPELAAAAERLSAAIEARLARLPDRLPAIEENAIWIRQRSLGCGIVGQAAIRYDEVDQIRACLLKVTEERTAVLRDPDFDCLAANTAAGALICADPSLALAETELNGEVLGLIGKLDPNAARFAFAEYGRWTRERDRKCNLVGKENVPLAELSSRKVVSLTLCGAGPTRSPRPKAIRRRCSAGRSRPNHPTPTPSISARRGFTPPIPAAISSASTASMRSTARLATRRRRSPARSRWSCWRPSPLVARSRPPARARVGICGQAVRSRQPQTESAPQRPSTSHAA